jgi:hypothetical protein
LGEGWDVNRFTLIGLIASARLHIRCGAAPDCLGLQHLDRILQGTLILKWI